MRFVFLAAILPLAGCVIPPPVVSSFNGSSVTVQTPGINPTTPPDAKETAVASAACGKPARFASGRKVADARIEYLFICG
jgi:hypothetical protein